MKKRIWLRSWRVRGIVFLLAGCIGGAVFLSRHRSPLELFPRNDTLFEFSGLNETCADSNYRLSVSDTCIDYTYSCARGYPSLLLHSIGMHRSLDISGYDRLEVVVDNDKSNDFSVTLYYFVPGISSHDSLTTQFPHSFRYHTETGQGHIDLHSRDFGVSHYWASRDSLPLEVPHYKKGLTHIAFRGLEDHPGTDEKRIVIRRIRFKSDISEDIQAAGMAAAAALLPLWVLVWILQSGRNRRIKRRIYGTPADRGGLRITDERAEEVMSYITSHFSDCMLTLDSLNTRFKLTPFQINEIVFSRFGMRYKQYLTHIRLKKAKELLRESDLPIAQIAKSVGYYYPNSFSRTFRNEMNCTPLEYRNSPHA
ncbi:MAG: helix-turn-helix domain-containing protein [Fibrobacterota bacterium]